MCNLFFFTYFFDTLLTRKKRQRHRVVQMLCYNRELSAMRCTYDDKRYKYSLYRFDNLLNDVQTKSNCLLSYLISQKINYIIFLFYLL